jgi:succinate dehydrogenase/fumarate reductase flavoprotein subunit
MALPNTSIYATSLEEVPVSVTAPIGVNPTGDTVLMAFLAAPPPVQPTSIQYVTATWQSTSAPYVALCLVGPGGVTTLGQGQWNVWIKITATPEVPVKYCGILQVT